ncbi:hypothetical protein BS50DRAFT_577372 [Corynespora cassiicola Philippines]|uniref:MPN domain-containing protein n=1 Tax=Corynespora cassiicola Philippines TaxID=1448308 RepID=A0A2T2NAR7_CORCC|nr:hypothetical protein BS50DRAFT_577372 [Corynespora cassiicola Philippines]
MASLGAPLSVQELTKQAENYHYNAFIPLQSWLRTAKTMQKEAQVYQAEGDDAQTYLLLYRHANLVLDHLMKHPDRNKPENKKALNAATVAVYGDLEKLEVLKPRIAKRHAEYQERRQAQLKALEALEGKGANVRALSRELDGLSVDNKTSRRRSNEKSMLDAEGNQSLAARLAQREVRRRDTARRSTVQGGISDEQEQERRTGGMWGDWESELQQTNEPEDDLSSQLQEVARMQQNGQLPPNASRRMSMHGPSPYHYPSVPHQSQERWVHPEPGPRVPGAAPSRPPKEAIHRPSDAASRPPVLPPKPPKTPTSVPLFEQPRPPPIPGKYSDAPPSGPPIPSKVPQPARPPATPSPDTDLDEFTFKPAAYLENGNPLRTVFLPSQLRKQFLSAAARNTHMNLETCGILCGILKSNALFITRLLIPEQTSTSDTCETINEHEIFDYCDKEELMVLGWIHTHPTQTCFMSSRDLHTHVGYQVMMPESIAIVCAPSKQPSWGCFRLTDPPGKQAILNCSQPGIFHPHHVENIYTEALKPGHVVELTNAPLEVIDMRPKK